MRLLLFISIVFCSGCKTSDGDSLVDRVTYDISFQDSFFLKNEWSYPDFIVKIDSTHFEDTVDGEISKEDTAHLVHTANIHFAGDSVGETLINDNSQIEKIRYGKAKLVGHSIVLTFSESTPSSTDDLIVKIKNGYFFTIYSGGSPPFGIRDYDFEHQILVFQKKAYQKGDTIKGFLDFRVQRPHYAHLKGSFKLPLK